MGERTDSVKDTPIELGTELDYQLANDDWTKESIWKRPLRRDTKIAVAIGAFVAVANGGASVTPTFSLSGTLYTNLSIVTSAAIGTACNGGTALTSGTAITPAAGSYDYCASYTGTWGAHRITLTWTQ